jgi:hypothetical protein
VGHTVVVWFWFYLLAVVPIVLTPWLAALKHRNLLFWGIVPFFVPLIPLIVVAILPEARPRANPYDGAPAPKEHPPEPFRARTYGLSLVALLVAGALFTSMLAYGTRRTYDTRKLWDPRLGVRSERAISSAVIVRVTGERRKDGMTFGEFARRRAAVETTCVRLDPAKFSYTAYLAEEGPHRLLWVVIMPYDGPFPGRCQSAVSDVSSMTIGGVDAEGHRVMVGTEGLPVGQFHATWLDDFRAGRAP